MTAVALATLAALGFVASAMLGLLGSRLPARGRTAAIAVAAAILLVVAFGDLYPESLEEAGSAAIAGFIGGFALLFVVEALTRGHTHHATDEPIHRHPLTPFLLGLALHNVADGFALGVAAGSPGMEAGLVGAGVLIHQVPVGLSLAAVLIADRVPRALVPRLVIPLGLAIPLATLATLAFPVPDAAVRGALVGGAGGVLAYLATAHLLPEAQGESGSRLTALIFVVTLAAMLLLLLTGPAE